MTDDKKIKSLEGCLLDSVYMTSEDWETYNELKAKAAKWDDPQTQADLELGQALRFAFSRQKALANGKRRFLITIGVIENLLNWYREYKRGVE